jgi:hypothetical protein
MAGVLPVRCIGSNLQAWADTVSQNASVPRAPGSVPAPKKTLVSMRRAHELLVFVRRAEKAEPQNAYYPLIEADIWRMAHNEQAMWDAIRRASQCARFDTHSVEIIRCCFEAQQKIRPLYLEEKRAVWEDNYWRPGESWLECPTRLAQLGRLARNNGQHRRAIEIGAQMARIGDLMQITETETQTGFGGSWKGYAWSIAPGEKRRSKRQQRAKNFALYASAHGRSDVARMVPKWLAFQAQVYKPRRPQSDTYWRAGWWRHAGLVVLWNLAYVAAFWLLANVFLWRGGGAPSSRSARIWPISVFSGFDPSTATPANNSALIFASSVALLCFFGAPLLLVVLCTFATLWSARHQFLRSHRTETELRLNAADNVLLKSGMTLLCGASLLSSLGFWLVWLVLVQRGVKTFDPLGWLPQTPPGAWWSANIPPEALALPLGYCLLLNGIGFVLWFVKWRYFSGLENRALTHGGLRRWKEALGIYLVLLSVLYFTVGICGWPVRAAANRELESRMGIGQ